MSSLSDIRRAITRSAHELGLRIGFSKAEPPARVDRFRDWLREGRAGTMTYLNRSAERRANPQLLLPGAKTIISVAQNYHTEPLPPEVRNDPSRGIIASYAWGQDYHDVLLKKVETLAEFIKSLDISTIRDPQPKPTGRDLPVADVMESQSFRFRDREVAASNSEIITKCCVDTGHILERDFGETAGLGFVGKNTMLIDPRGGSCFFLGEIITNLDLPPTPSPPMPNCGSCTKCLTVCPTHALPAEFILDSNLCISYLTIEYKGIIDRALRAKMGNHIFGCDDCQDCCPWNRFASPTDEKACAAKPERKAPKLSTLAFMNESEFRERFARSPVLRPKFTGMMRNTAIALGNRGSEEALGPLEHLLHSRSPLVRLHAAWGIGQIACEQSRRLLRKTLSDDEDEPVRQEAAEMLD